MNGWELLHTYIPPIDHYRFLLGETLDFESVMDDLHRDVDAEFAATILGQAGKL